MATPATDGSGGTAHRKIVTLCTIIATLMQSLDSTIANVALPYMQGNLSATSDQITWVLTSYIVAAAIMTAPIGWLAGRFGRKRFFIVCLAGFTVASMLCGVAQSLPQMVIFRLLQGVFGAALVPLSQATMFDIYPPEQRGSAMALWGMGVMVGPILGPTLGGYLTDVYDWRWVFFINLPFGIVAILGLWFFLEESIIDKAKQFDWTGFIALSVGVGGLQLMLDRGEQADWFGSREIIIETVLAGVGLYVFVVHVWLAPKPFIAPRMFKDRNFSAGLVVMFMIGLVLLSSSALLAPYLQSLGGYPVAEAGLLMAPRGVGTMITMMVAGRLSSKVDGRYLMLVGIALLAWSLNQMTTWTADIDPLSLASVTIVQGLGLGFVFPPLQVLAFATLPAELRTDGTALFSLVRNIGSAIGISVMSFLLAQNTQIMHAQIAERLTPFNHMMQTLGAYFFWNNASAPGLAALNAEVTHQAVAIAYTNDFKLMFLVSLPIALLILLMRRTRPMAIDPSHAVMD
mgnify:CR=1 FL=1